MSYLFHVLFALGTLSLADLGWVSSGEHAWIAPLLALVPYLLGAASRRSFLLGHFRLGATLERLLVIAPVVLQALAVVSLGWLGWLERWDMGVAALDDWDGLGLLPALVPYYLYQVAAIDARARCLVFRGDSTSSVRSFQLRLFLSALLPFVLYLACSSLITRSPARRVYLEEVGLIGASALVAIFAVFLYSMPFFLRVAWHTAPLERGWARTMLEQVAENAGFHFRELLVWNTGQQMSNAAIVGFTARSRHVFFSDLLLQQLGPRELAAVFAHEMGHARRGHALTFGAIALGFFLTANLVLGHVDVESTLWLGVLLAGALALWYFGFGFLSRRFELEADLESLRVVSDSGALIRALELVTGAHAHERSSWRHFSTRERVAFLRRAELDPLVGIQLKLSLARWRKWGFALFLVAATLQVFSLARSWDEDWLVAELRLGRFEEAASRAEGEHVDPELAVLARFAAGPEVVDRDPGALERSARDAFRKGNLTGALARLELARLRGSEELDPLVAYLKEGGQPGVVPEGVPLAWRTLLRAGTRPGNGGEGPPSR